VSADDRGCLLGEGLFETLLVLNGQPQQLDAHLERMRASARALGLSPPGKIELSPILSRLAESPRAVLRITLTAGSGRGLVPLDELPVRTTCSAAPLPDVADRTPFAAVTVSAHRVDPTAAISGHKVLSWMPWILARKEALDRGADVALVTTVDGDVCEADHANLFAVVAGTIVTPSLDRGVLPGVTRARALATLRDAGHAVEERALRPEELAVASEAWLTSSLDGVRGLASIDGRTVAAPGKLTAWLADCIECP
jgi:branched-subunit amino acid aminotransferase/4-amino-4-deoxychorismate lyase